MELFKEAALHAGEDTLAILPFLFIIYFILELLEHRFSHKTPDLRRFGPVLGSAAGLLPQCGFSLAITTLFNKRVVSMGTLLAVYLSTSDEAVPILLAQPEQFPVVIKILSLKFLIGMLAGIFIDFFIKKPDADDCFCSDCHQHTPPHQHHHHTTAFPAIVSHSIKKTLQIFVFLFVSMFVLTWIILLVGQQQLEEILSAGSALQPFVCSLIGLIPTCVPSILITQLLAADIIPFGSAMAGLCASSGMGLLLLLKENRDPRRTLLVLALLYLISAFTGLLLNGISLL